MSESFSLTSLVAALEEEDDVFGSMFDEMGDVLDQIQIQQMHVETAERFIKWIREHPKHSYPRTRSGWISFILHTCSIAYWPLSQTQIRHYLSCELEDLKPTIRTVVEQYHRGEFVIHGNNVLVKMSINPQWLYKFLVKQGHIREINETYTIREAAVTVALGVTTLSKRARTDISKDTEDESTAIWPADQQCSKRIKR